MLRAYVDARQLNTIANRFKTAKGKARQTNGVAQQLAKRLGKLVMERFESTKKDPWGRAWKKWSKEYAKTRSSGHSLLRDTDKLMKSIRTSYTGRSVKIESTDPKASFVQRLRPFIGVGPDEIAATRDVAENWLRRLV